MLCVEDIIGRMRMSEIRSAATELIVTDSEDREHILERLEEIEEERDSDEN